MDIFLIIGIVTGLLSVVVGMIVKGADVHVLLNPAAAIIIFVGTAAAVTNSFPKGELATLGGLLKVLIRKDGGHDPVKVIDLIVSMAHTARREGLLSLESAMDNIENEFLKKGMLMVIDGIEEAEIRDILEVEIESLEDRHRGGAQIFTTAGGAAPTLGVLGAVIGLIGALGNLEDIERLGHMIAAAFVATLYGIFTGYVICHPFATRLKRKSHEEIRTMNIIIEGVLAIQAGTNPNTIKMKLVGMLSPKQRAFFDKKDKEAEQSS